MMVAMSCAFGVLALGALLGLICRLNMLHWRDSAAASICMHVGLAFACLWAIHDALLGRINPGSIGAVLATICWLIVSFPTWSVAPPAHARKR